MDFPRAGHREVVHGGQITVDRRPPTCAFRFLGVFVVAPQGSADDPDGNALGEHDKVNSWTTVDRANMMATQVESKGGVVPCVTSFAESICLVWWPVFRWPARPPGRRSSLCRPA